MGKGRPNGAGAAGVWGRGIAGDGGGGVAGVRGARWSWLSVLQEVGKVVGFWGGGVRQRVWVQGSQTGCPISSA